MELPELGTTFQSKYRLDEVLGEGGFARVYEALDVGAQRTVALKILKPLEDGYARDTESRFHREVKVVAGLRDPHTVTMFDFGRSNDGLLFMVFEYVPGVDLSQVLEDRGPLGDEATIHILRQVLQSLREAHQGGLLHRDLKPANIRIYEYMGDPFRVTLLDFGIAKPLMPGSEVSAITHSGSLVGTPQYMSPEQLLEKQLTPASDVYSLGLVAYEMLTGTTAIKGNSLSDQLHVLAGPTGLCLPPDAPVSVGLRRIVDRMISREPTTRMQTAEHVLRSLEALVRGEATADVSLEEIGGRRPNTGSQPLQAPPGSQPLRAPSGSQPLQAPSGSQPLQAPSGSFPMRPPSGSSPLNALPREHSSDSMERAAYYPPHTTGPVPGVGDEDGELPMAWLIGGLVAILLCLALVISVGVKMLDQPEKPAPRTLHIPPSLSATPDEPVTPTAAKPVAKPVKPELAAPDGCGKAGAPFLGAGELHVDEVLEKKTVRVYIPKGYDPKVPQPVLVAFHDVQQTPQAALERFGLDKLADREGLIVLLPYDDGLAVWKKPRGVQRAYDDFLAAQTVLCIDKDRVYGFGHGAGGRAAARMPCDFPGVTAIATTAFRTEPDERECLAEKRVPYLHVAATKDHASPPKGGRGCGGTRAISIREYETEYRQHHDCAPRTRKWKSEKNAVCDTWECKEADFVSCRVEGGREWPGPVRSVDKAAEMFVRASCDGKPADFPYQDTIWQFFEEVTPKPEADK